LLLKLLQIQE